MEGKKGNNALNLFVKNSKKTLGIIIPVYNSVDYIEDCLESIKKQTVKFDQVIIINDGSTDGSELLCQRFSALDDRCVYQSQKNCGPSIARNKGIELCNTDYLVFLDSDDKITEKYCEILHGVLEMQDIIFFSADIIDEIGWKKDKRFYIRETEELNDVVTGIDFLYKTFINNYIVSPCLAAFRREFLLNNEIFFPEGLLHEDNLFFFKTVLFAKRISCIKDALYLRRYRSGSIMTTKNKRKVRDRIVIERMIWRLIKKNDLTDNTMRLILMKNMLRIFSEAKRMSCENEKEYLTFLVDFFNEWIDDEFIEGLSVFNVSVLLLLYKKLENERIIELLPGLNRLPELYNSKIIEMLKKIALNRKDRRIAIYGMGHHTRIFLRLYEKYIGAIINPYAYILTEQIEKEKDGHRIYKINDCPDCIDEIVISSYEYQKEMIRLSEYNGISKNKLVTFYDDLDIVDLVFVYEKLAQ